MRDGGKGGLLQSHVVDLRKEITVKIKKQQKQPRFPSTGSVRYNFSQEKLKLAAKCGLFTLQWGIEVIPILKILRSTFMRGEWLYLRLFSKTTQKQKKLCSHGSNAFSPQKHVEVGPGDVHLRRPQLNKQNKKIYGAQGLSSSHCVLCSRILRPKKRQTRSFSTHPCILLHRYHHCLCLLLCCLLCHHLFIFFIFFAFIFFFFIFIFCVWMLRAVQVHFCVENRRQHWVPFLRCCSLF